MICRQGAVTSGRHIPNISVSVSPVERQITKIKGDEIMKTAVIYARYSSDSQTEQSIEGQMRVCEEYARNNDIVILARYIDRAMTGTNDNRPDFQRMLKDSDSRTWNYVLVYKLDRFSRNKYEMAVHKKTLKDNGVRVISATEYIPDSPEAIILESMLEGYAEYYSAELSQKIKAEASERVPNDIMDAMMGFLHYAFYELNLNCIYGTVLEYNHLSRKLARKCGLKEEGVLRERIFKNGK